MGLSEREKGLIETLDLVVKEKFMAAVAEMDEAGVNYYVSECRRPLIRQLLLAFQERLGDIPFSDLQWAAKEAGYAPPTSNKKCTKTLKSNHYTGRAIDMCAYNPDTNTPLWDVVGDKMVEIMEKHGFTWGGRWNTFYDPGHWEMPNG